MSNYFQDVKPSPIINIPVRNYMLSVYNYVGIGLFISFLSAIFFQEANLNSIIATNSGMFLLFFIVFMFSMIYLINNLKNGFLVFLVYSIFCLLEGMMLSSIFSIYTSQSIISTFLLASINFLSLSIYGYITKKDLTAFGSFLILGLFGLIISMVFSFFFHSTELQFLINFFGVLIFSGLVAFDTQKIKNDFLIGLVSNPIKSALMLYLNFINLFLFMLNFSGSKK